MRGGKHEGPIGSSPPSLGGSTFAEHLVLFSPGAFCCAGGLPAEHTQRNAWLGGVSYQGILIVQ